MFLLNCKTKYSVRSNKALIEYSIFCFREKYEKLNEYVEEQHHKATALMQQEDANVSLTLKYPLMHFICTLIIPEIFVIGLLES